MIAIIGILVALLFPQCNRAGSGRRINCTAICGKSGSRDACFLRRPVSFPQTSHTDLAGPGFSRLGAVHGKLQLRICPTDPKRVEPPRLALMSSYVMNGYLATPGIPARDPELQPAAAKSKTMTAFEITDTAPVRSQLGPRPFLRLVHEQRSEAGRTWSRASTTTSPPRAARRPTTVPPIASRRTDRLAHDARWVAAVDMISPKPQ